jgi:hypothetical protein
MTMRTLWMWTLLAWAAAVYGCGDDDSNGDDSADGGDSDGDGDGDGDGAGDGDGDGQGDGDDSTDGAGDDDADDQGDGDGDIDAGTPDAGEPGDDGDGDGTDPPTPEYNEMGCLTYASASELCGTASNGDVCAKAAACGQDQDQCSINCEMAAAVYCIESAQVEACLGALDAVCEDFSGACSGWL